MSWIHTYTGRKIDPLNMTPDDVDIEDIAHALALANRFNGHTYAPYSVAQHSVAVSRLTPNALWGLLHDAPEAYMCDMSRPCKQAFREAGITAFEDAEDQIMRAVCTRYGLEWPMPQSVKDADEAMLVREAWSFFRHQPLYRLWQHYTTEQQELVVPELWSEAKIRFKRRFKELTGTP